MTTRLFVDGQGMAGGSQHLLGDIIRSLQPRYLSQVAGAVQSNMKGMAQVQVDSFCAALADEIPTWQELEKRLPSKSKQSSTNTGPSAAATTRLFGRSDEPVVTLYRDSAAWCPYCQKVWIALEEKQIPYQVVRIDMRCYGKGKPSEFLKLQPNGNLPCAVFRDVQTNRETVVRESNDIIDGLEALATVLSSSPAAAAAATTSKTPTLRPSNQEDRIRNLCDNGRESLERRLYTRWMWWLTGVRRPDEYKELFLEHWQEMEDALGEQSSGPYFLGKELSVVDIRFIPFVERQLASLTYFKGADYLRDAKRYPNIVKWLEAMESRPSYQATKSDYYCHSRALPPQWAADCVSEAGACEDMQASIDSCPVGDGTIDWTEPGWQWYDFSNAAKEAATKLIEGNEKIVAFSARGAGIAGLPAASAPLADPAATPNASILPAVDLLLRHVANSLLNKKSNSGWLSPVAMMSAGTSSSDLLQEAVGTLDKVSTQALADCLDYLRERIGVPRDMTYPAAQELRKVLLDVRSLLLVPSSAAKSVASELVSQ